MISITIDRRVGLIAASTALSWLGFYIHNVVDLPGQTLLSPETGLPTLVTLGLFLAWWWLPFKRLSMLALLVWALVQLVGGGILSVIPLSFWPFYPPQTMLHYLMHVVFAGAQLPLIVASLQQLRRMNWRRRA
jgi:hypothetical protein